MKREFLESFLYRKVIITFIDGEVANGRLFRDDLRIKKYRLVRYSSCDIIFPLSVVKSVKEVC